MTDEEVFAFPLSYAQQRLWFLDQLAPGNSFYNVPAVVRLKFGLNAGVLERALNELLRRHESLRTRFGSVNGQPVQLIAAQQQLELGREDLRGLAEAERGKRARALAEEMGRRAFDLSRGPLVRAAVVQLGEQDYLFMLTLHHIISDGWSMGILWRELNELYGALVAGRAVGLAELPIQYADYAVWQREYLSGAVLEEQLGYWREQLRELSVLELPTDRERPGVQSFHGAYLEVKLAEQLSEQLRELSRREGVTLFMTLLAGWKVLLARYCNQTDIVVGSPIAGRNRSELEGLIGFFVNTLVLRTDLSGDPSFKEVIQRVREMALSAYAHQEVPFEMLVEELQPERDLGRNPLFQVTFQLQSAGPLAARVGPGGSSAGRAATAEEMGAEGLGVQRGTAIFDMAFHLWETAGGIAGGIEYSTELFRGETVARMAAQYERLLAGMVANVEQRSSAVPLLSAAEREQELRGWQGQWPGPAESAGLHELFEQQVRRTPAALAVESEQEQVSYAELNERANRLGHYLRARGVRAEVRVGVMVERGVELVEALLGVLKAGGSYLPVDGRYPAQRLRQLLSDAELGLLLVGNEQQRQECVAAGVAVAIVVLESERPRLLEESGANVPSGVSGANLAYIIYTSGSTGKPKGVMIEHRSICNHMIWMQDTFPLTERDKVLQRTPFTFDASVWEFYAPLLVGATLVMAPPETHQDGAFLVSVLGKYRITILQLVPSLLRLLLGELDHAACATLKRVFCGGEALTKELQKQFFRCLTASLHNLYGPTEATVDATYWTCDPESDRALIPIGHPIWNTEAYLLDRHLEPVPLGTTAELYIGGEGLARGYLHRPELTAERFIPHPFSAQPGQRLYRTGDLARRRADGAIEYVGRADQQVKLRGYRIELGEVEAVLREHGLVKEVVVEVQAGSGAGRLVAYVVPEYNDQEPEEDQQQWSTEQVVRWQRVYDDVFYNKVTNPSFDPVDPIFNIVGWNSSYTGLPLPAEEMREWVNDTVERIRCLQPRRVLEIGCGTGLLLFRVAHSCDSYLGTDFSFAALNYIDRQLATSETPLRQVKLLQKRAEDFSGIEDSAFDTIILNSVVQYFPTINYLGTVLKKACRAVAPGGSIFIGDVRSLPLLQAFHMSVALQNAPATMSTEELQQYAQKTVSEEQELVIDPAFFTALPRYLPEITHVKIQPKLGHYRNELTKFRYDVTLHIGKEVHAGSEPLPECDWLDWQQEDLTPLSLHHWLAENQPPLLGIERIPDARLRTELLTLELLGNEEVPPAVTDLLSALSNSHNRGAEPKAILEAVANLPYSVDIRRSEATGEGFYDLIFTRNRGIEADEFNGNNLHLFSSGKGSLKSWNRYANNPLQGMSTQKLVPQWRGWLEERLPDYMVPSAFVLLESLPLTASGKINRRALPAPDQSRPELARAYVAPRTPIEQDVAQLYGEVLGVKQVGVYDNFFTELGGHSLLAMQLMSRVRDHFKLELPLRLFFESPSVAELCICIATQIDGAQQNGNVKSRRITRRAEESLLPSLDQLSDEEVTSLLKNLLPGEEALP